MKNCLIFRNLVILELPIADSGSIDLDLPFDQEDFELSEQPLTLLLAILDYNQLEVPEEQFPIIDEPQDDFAINLYRNKTFNQLELPHINNWDLKPHISFSSLFASDQFETNHSDISPSDINQRCMSKSPIFADFNDEKYHNSEKSRYSE